MFQVPCFKVNMNDTNIRLICEISVRFATYGLFFYLNTNCTNDTNLISYEKPAGNPAPYFWFRFHVSSSMFQGEHE